MQEQECESRPSTAGTGSRSVFGRCPGRTSPRSTEHWGGAKSFTSSPWAYDGKVYCLDQDGQSFVLRAGPRFELVRTNEIQDMFWATPAVARDALYLREADQVYCIKQ